MRCRAPVSSGRWARAVLLTRAGHREQDLPAVADGRHETEGERIVREPGNLLRGAGAEDDSGAGPTVLRTLVEERHWQTPKAFRAQFLRAARELADRDSDREFGRLDVSQRQFCRWLAGAQPRPYACRVLEYMFGLPIGELLRPAVAPVPP